MENILIAIEGCADNKSQIANLITYLLNLNERIACLDISKHYEETLAPKFNQNKKCIPLLQSLDFYSYEIHVEEQLKVTNIIACDYYKFNDDIHIRSRPIHPHMAFYIYDKKNEAGCSHFKRMAEHYKIKYHILEKCDLIAENIYSKLIDDQDILMSLLNNKEDENESIDLSLFNLIEEEEQVDARIAWESYLKNTKQVNVVFSDQYINMHLVSANV
jgi:hypothetical protein